MALTRSPAVWEPLSGELPGATRGFFAPSRWQLHPSMYSPGSSARPVRVAAFALLPTPSLTEFAPTWHWERWPVCGAILLLGRTAPLAGMLAYGGADVGFADTSPWHRGRACFSRGVLPLALVWRSLPRP